MQQPIFFVSESCYPMCIVQCTFSPKPYIQSWHVCEVFHSPVVAICEAEVHVAEVAALGAVAAAVTAAVHRGRWVRRGKHGGGRRHGLAERAERGGGGQGGVHVVGVFGRRQRRGT